MMGTSLFEILTELDDSIEIGSGLVHAHLLPVIWTVTCETLTVHAVLEKSRTYLGLTKSGLSRHRSRRSECRGVAVPASESPLAPASGFGALSRRPRTVEAFLSIPCSGGPHESGRGDQQRAAALAGAS